MGRRAATYFGMSGSIEFTVAALLFVALLALKIVSSLHQRFDSDEPQHLHVIWSWTQGLVQYRDIFDNHMPLFHVMFAPLAGLIGERATILYWMRLLLLPLYFVSAWATYRIGTQLFSRRIGVWSAIALGFYPGYHVTALEFRPDNLWAPVWLLCLLVLLDGPLNPKRALVAGLLLGMCFGVSMKSSILLVAVLCGAGFTLASIGRERLSLPTIRLVQCAGIFLAATALVPALIMFFLWARDVWPDFSNCVFGHQFLADLYHEKQAIYAALALVIFPIAIRVVRSFVGTVGIQVGVRRAFIVLVACSYFLVLRSIWPLIARTDYLPLYPLIFVLLIGTLFAFAEKMDAPRWRFGRILRVVPVPAFLTIMEVFVLLQTKPFWRDDTKPETSMLRDTLTLTTARDYVFDCKGETVFRHRSFRPVLETITRKRIVRGLIADDAPQRCVETRTAVAATVMIQRLSPRARDFVERTYLPVTDSLRVAGVKLEPSAGNSRHFDFEIVIPSTYKIISPDGIILGILDGATCDGARFLEAGPHSFDSTSTSGPLFCLWAQAVDRNFMPFGH